MTNPLSAYFFDLDGTLLNTAPDIATAMKKTLEGQGKTLASTIENNYHLFGNSSELLSELLNLPMHEEPFLTIQQAFFQHYLNDIANQTNYYPEIHNTLNLLIEKSIPWGIITNKPHILTTELLSHFPLLQQACICISGDSLPEQKPSPKPLLHACQSLQLDPAQCCYIGDTDTDCLAAQRAGMQSVAVLYGYRKPHDNPQSWLANHYCDTSESLHHWISGQLCLH